MPYHDKSLDNQSFAATGASLDHEVSAALPRLRAISEVAAAQAHGSGTWSSKQILGHLIDSAANNHQRFIRGQSVPELRIVGYEQEHWVASQRHDLRAWTDLVDLWSAYNRHLAHVIAHIPESLRATPVFISDDDPMTLGVVAIDYVGHLQHHLRQIMSARPG